MKCSRIGHGSIGLSNAQNSAVGTGLKIGLARVASNYQSHSNIHRSGPEAAFPPTVSLFDFWPAI